MDSGMSTGANTNVLFFKGRHPQTREARHIRVCSQLYEGVSLLHDGIPSNVVPLSVDGNHQSAPLRQPLGHTALSEEAATCHRTQFLSGSLYSSHTASLLRLLSLFLSVERATSLSALDQTLSKVAVCDTVDAAMARS